MKRLHSTNRWVRGVYATGLMLALGGVTMGYSPKANEASKNEASSNEERKNKAKNEDKKSVSPSIIATPLTLQKEDAKVTMMTLHGESISVSVQPDTLIAGMCVHCNLMMEVKAGQNAKDCKKCACSLSNTECFVNQVTGKNGWADMFTAFPNGTVLLVEYVAAGKPESGLKRLTIDHKAALLQIKSASIPTVEALTSAAKAVGGTSVELGNEGTRLLIHLKNDWSRDKATRLAKSLAQIGVEIACPVQVTGAK